MEGNLSISQPLGENLPRIRVLLTLSPSEAKPWKRVSSRLHACSAQDGEMQLFQICPISLFIHVLPDTPLPLRCDA